MLLTDPGRTAYDVNFTFAGFPVRISPFFWVIAAFIGWVDHNLGLTAARIGCVALSILVHELGHAWSARAFGAHGGRIVLHGLGGYATHQGRLGKWQNIAMIAAGPGAGFLLAGAAFLSWRIPGARLPGEIGANVTYFLIWINLVWSIFNLIPIYPMDGGQISMNLLRIFKGYSGELWSLRISIGCGIALITLALISGEIFLLILVGMMVWENVQLLSAGGPSGLQRRMDPWQKPSDWWK